MKEKQKRWLATINADWGRNISVRMDAPFPVNRETAEERAESIKDRYGDRSLKSTVVDVSPRGSK